MRRAGANGYSYAYEEDEAPPGCLKRCVRGDGWTDWDAEDDDHECDVCGICSTVERLCVCQPCRRGPPRPGMTIREALFLTPWEKWVKYGKFPWKLVFNLFVVASSTTQVRADGRFARLVRRRRAAPPSSEGDWSVHC